MMATVSERQAAALMRGRLTRKRRSRRVLLGPTPAGIAWRASTNYGVEVLAYNQERAALFLDTARRAVNETLAGEPIEEWLD